MHRLLLFVFLFCLSPFVQAKSHYFKSAKSLKVAEIYQEGLFWNLDLYKIRPNELQERGFSKSYSSESVALEKLKEITGGDTKLSYEEWQREFEEDSYQTQTEVQNKVLWRAKYEWNKEWEEKYYQWIEENFTSDFFVEYGIKTDCADVAIMLHWIFARIHSLPAANTLAGSRKLLTHESMKSSWLRYPTAKEWNKDKRFLQVLNYLADNTYTHSLGPDSYPVRISQETLRPGILHLVLFEETGHTRLVAETNYDNPKKVPILLYSSTVPRAVRPLMVEVPASLSGPSSKLEGFRAIRWPIKMSGRWRLMKAEAHPSYSRQQFEAPFGEESEFGKVVLETLVPNLDWKAVVAGMMNDIHQQFLARVQVVEDGYKACQKADCSEGTAAYEAWSTPSRDKRIRENIGFTEALIGSLGNPEINELWEKYTRATKIELFGSSVSLSYLTQNWMKSFFVSDPTASPRVRWLVEPEGIREYILTELTKILQRRESKIQKGSCSSEKDFQDPCVQQRQTLVEDEKWRSLTSLRNQFCGLRDDQDCKKLNELLIEKDLEFANQTMSLPDWLELSYLSTWDPRDSEDQRWGRQAVKAQLFGPAHTVLALSQSSALMSFEDRLYLQDPQGRLMLDCDGIQVSPDSMSALCLRGTRVFFVGLENAWAEQLILEMKRPSDFQGVLWIDASQFAITTPNQILVFSKAKDEVILTTKMEAWIQAEYWDFVEKPLFLSDVYRTIFVVTKDQQQYLGRVSVAGELILSNQAIPADTEDVLAWSGDRALLQTSEKLHLWSLSDSLSLGEWVFDSTFDVGLPGRSIRVGFDFGMSHTLVGWGEDLNAVVLPVNEQGLFLKGISAYKSEVVVSFGGREPMHYKWNGREFEKLRDPSGFSRIAVSGDFQLLKQVSNNELGLYHEGSAKALMHLGPYIGWSGFCSSTDFRIPRILNQSPCSVADGAGVFSLSIYAVGSAPYLTSSYHYFDNNKLQLKLFYGLKNPDRSDSRLSFSDYEVEGKAQAGSLISIGDHFWLHAM